MTTTPVKYNLEQTPPQHASHCVEQALCSAREICGMPKFVAASAGSARVLARLDIPPQHARTPLEGSNRHAGLHRLALPAHRAPQGPIAVPQPPLINALDVVGMLAEKEPAGLLRFLPLKAYDARLVLSVDHTFVHVLLFGHGLRKAHSLEFCSEGILQHVNGVPSARRLRRCTPEVRAHAICHRCDRPKPKKNIAHTAATMKSPVMMRTHANSPSAARITANTTRIVKQMQVGVATRQQLLL
eukprot:CAMPEP_0177334518 /NCGR_PEP_ID=MMETSP0368-20130122/22766_1 /TAXON_ID=447022 ORGANISM="Scrippsiella hangoei-like, Strain SHHI-4" /NCGR_SAMPLE_ID=MMETSP0368 /ASSEMBLY_ACC=CAM_ASM_000363 /LENGTH=242 /DNA_ID=CAMNT_0018795251 /DNA_START=513 /DNA_END=1240 /DNA_ORIENTATION=-